MSAAPVLRVLVVDDEQLARERIADLLKDMPDVLLVGQSADGFSAVEAVQRLEPDVLFLDVQMPGMTGLEVVRALDVQNPPVVIFVTAFDRYALKAFDAAAIDYLLKPFSDERFEQALGRARTLILLRQNGAALAAIRGLLGASRDDGAELGHAAAYTTRIAVESRGQIRSVPVEHIEYISASGVYAELHAAGKTYVVREAMQLLAGRLDPRKFFRIHRSAIVQLNCIDALHRQGGGDYTLRMKCGALLNVSRNRVRQLESWMGVVERSSIA
jgi:two-component system LytT family response regulator